MKLNQPLLEAILDALPRLRIGVLGDLFLDRYFDLDSALTEKSLETGLNAHQVFRVRAHPGAAGTVINNLAAFGVGSVHPISVIGDDGEGYELRRALDTLPNVDSSDVVTIGGRHTPTYMKPILHEDGKSPRELNRLDIKNRAPLDQMAEMFIANALTGLWPRIDALLVLDQVGECGVVSERAFEQLAELGRSEPERFILADSRCRIGQFRNVAIKPNRAEVLEACKAAIRTNSTSECAMFLARRNQRPVFCTDGAQGMWVADPNDPQAQCVAAFPVDGAIDIVGAGDSAAAGLACAIAAGASLAAAACFANLVASITIQQIGTTGTATPAQISECWRTYAGAGIPIRRSQR